MERYESFFGRYEALAEAADRIFERVKTEFPDELTCRVGCSDCCHAVFDVTLVEALYLNHYFNRLYGEAVRAPLLEKANRADRTVFKIKRDAKKRLDKGAREEDLLVTMAAERVRCPLLNERNQCDLYDHRPITCRLYGVPTEIGGLTHSCGKAGFEKGKSYPTVHLDKMNQQLFSLAAALVDTIGSRFSALAELVMPVSAAMLTVFDDAFLGIETKMDEPPRETKGDDDGDR